MRAHLLGLALSLAACVNLPAAMRPASIEDRAAVAAVRDAWAASGREPTACPQLDRLHVADLPLAEVQGRCHNPRARACVTSGRDLFEAPRANVYLAIESPNRRALLVHEILHVQRGCWVLDGEAAGDYLERYHAGRRAPDCDPRTMQDLAHCDAEMWGPIEADAMARLRGVR